MLIVRLAAGEYTNDNAPENVLHYLSSSHNSGNVQRSCLLFFSPNMIGTPEQMAALMKITQQMYHNYPSGWKRIHHLVITLPRDRHIKRPGIFWFAELAAGHFASFGFQTAVAVFYNQGISQYEVHLGVNSINAYNGMILQFKADLLPVLEALFSDFFQLVRDP